MRANVALAALGLALGACVKGERVEVRPPAPLPEALPEPAAEALRLTGVTVVGATAEGEKPGPDFPMMDTRDVVVRMNFSAAPGNYEVKVAFLAPSGDRFMTVDAPVAIPESRSATSEARLPVAGGQVQNYGLTGEWSARVEVGETVAATAPFRVTR